MKESGKCSIKEFRHCKNYNDGLRSCNGKFIAFIASDDL